MVKVFVPGPNAGTSFVGSPSQYLTNISRITQQRRNNRLAQDELAAQKVFQEGRLANEQERLGLLQRQQAYTEAAPEREEAQRLAALARENEKLTYAKNIAQGAQHAGGGRFTDFEEVLSQVPGWNQMSDAEKLQARNEYILQNPNKLTSPEEFSKIYKAGLMQSGLYTGEEIDKFLERELSDRYKTANPDIIKSLLAKPGSTGRSNSVFNTTGGSTSGSGKPVRDTTNPDQREESIDRIAKLHDLDNNPSFLPDWMGGGRIDVFKPDVTREDLSTIMGIMQTVGGVTSPTAVESAITTLIKNGKIPEAFDWTTPEGRKNLGDLAIRAQAEEERTRGASGSSIFGGNIAEMNAYNANLLRQMARAAESDDSIIEDFLGGLGLEAPGATPTQDATRQGGNQGAGVVGSSTPNPSPQKVIPTPQPEAEFQIGGPTEEELKLKELTDYVTSSVNTPVGYLADKAAPTAAKVFGDLMDSLTVNPSGVTFSANPQPNPQPSPQQAQQAQRAIRLQEVQEEISNLPPPAQRTPAQTAYARSLEKELKELQ